MVPHSLSKAPFTTGHSTTSQAARSLRHTFGTHLSKNGVPPRTAQAALRHSSLDLTMNVYTDPTLLDVPGALAALPELSLSDEALAGAERAAQ